MTQQHHSCAHPEVCIVGVDEQERIRRIHASHFPLTRTSLLFYLRAAARGQIGTHVSLDRMFREVTKLTGDPCHDRNIKRAIALLEA